MITPYDIASARVYTDARLTIYADILLDYDWQEGDDSFEWVATAPITEILDWCAEIRSIEDEAIAMWQLV